MSFSAFMQPKPYTYPFLFWQRRGTKEKNLHRRITKEQRRSTKEKHGQNTTNVGVSANTKVLIFLGYFAFFYSTYIATIGAYSNAKLNAEFGARVAKYFACEANGSNLNRTCSSERMAYEALTHPEFIIAFHILFVLYPVATLIFIVRLRRKSVDKR